MLSFPISKGTFRKSFLAGAGEIQIATDNDVWRTLVESGGNFTPGIDRIADVNFQMPTQALKLGGAGGIKLGVSAGAAHQIQILFPGASARQLTPGADQLLVSLNFHGNADASASGSAPVGPLKTTFGVTAGGSFSYERWKLYSQTQPAREILADLFAGIRLPQQIDSPAEIPGNGEVLASRFGGYLTLSGKVSYGYSMTGSRNLDVGRLNLDLEYKLRVAATLNTSYRLAGEFDIEARAGGQPGFVRFVVRKSRESEFNFAADFGADAELHLAGLPDSADEFLAKTIGAHAEQVLDLFAQGKKYSNLQELETAAGRLAKGAVHGLAERFIGEALTNATFDQFLKKALAAVEAYNQVDRRIIHLYEDFMGQHPQLLQMLDKIESATGPGALRNLSDNRLWQLAERLAGPKVYDILVDETAFGDFVRLVKEAQAFLTDGAQAQVRTLIQDLKAAFPLNDLLAQLNGIKTPQQLGNLANERLQGLVEKLLGRGFDEIRKSKLSNSLKELNQTLVSIEGFKKTYYAKLKSLANRSFQAQLHFEYSRASKSTALLDIEIDVRTVEGPRLARAAAVGDFAEVLRGYNSTIVRVHQGVFTHSAISSTQLQINLFGFGAESMTRMLQDTEHSLEEHDGGLLHVYASTTMIEERRKHGGELTASSFLLSTVASAFQASEAREFLIRTLPKMSVRYSLLKEDDKTSPRELRQILELAEIAGILPDREAFTQQLQREFPQGLGKVSAQYVVRYADQDAALAFTLPAERLPKLSTDVMRAFLAAKWTNGKANDFMPRLGFAYLDPATVKLIKNGAAHISVTLPSWFTKSAPITVELSELQKRDLTRLYSVERNYVKALVELDAAIDALRDHTAAISPENLNKLAKKFVEMSDDLNDLRENAFFAVFDRLVQEGSAGRARRASALVLEITPPDGEKVTKILNA